MRRPGSIGLDRRVATCFHHPDRETGRACTRCGRPACLDCLHEAPVGAHCWECIRAARPPVRERARRWNATAGLVVTKALIALNLAVFVVTALQGGLAGRGGDLQVRLAVFGPFVDAGEWYRLVTSGFVHFGLIHVGFNMVLLYRFGELLEPALGRIRFGALYFAALLAGSAGALLVAPMALTGGASGAVFGLVGAAAVAQHRHGVGIWQSGIGGLLVLNLIFTFAIPNISIGGHIGGLLGGAALGAAMFRWAPSSASSRSTRATLEGVVLATAVAAVAVIVALGAAAS